MYSYSYKYKAQFYRYLDLDSDTRELLKKYHKAKDRAVKGETIYFVTKEQFDEIRRGR